MTTTVTIESRRARGTHMISRFARWWLGELAGVFGGASASLDRRRLDVLELSLSASHVAAAGRTGNRRRELVKLERTAAPDSEAPFEQRQREEPDSRAPGHLPLSAA